MVLWWHSFLAWLRDNQISDLISILSVIGFIFTIINLFRTKSAAERAELAAKEAKESINVFETVSDFTTAIIVLEEIKRIHRTEQWVLLPDRYASIRKILITLQARGQLSEGQAEAVTAAITNLSNMERAVERGLTTKAKLRPSTFNAVLLEDIDKLLRVLSEVKSSRSGV